MTFEKSKALTLLDLCEASYALATTGHCVLPPGFSDPVAIRLPAEGRPYFLNKDPLDIFGFVTMNAGTTYIVFRGTQITSGMDFMQEWIQDAVSLPLKVLGAGHVHLGFYDAWMALRLAVENVINPLWTEIVITGHSLGAAIATCCWADIGGSLLTFASPRVGDPEFSTALWNGQTVRVVNKPDIVPDVPIDTGGPHSFFRHGGTEIKIDGPGFLHPHIAHNLESYRAGILKLTGE
jgi:predicted lipase